MIDPRIITAEEAFEEWRDIPGWEDHYQVSNHGRARSLPRNAFRTDGKPCRIKGRTLAQNEGKWGHLRVTLHRGGRGPSRISKTAWVHQLVCEAFNGPKPTGMWSLHADGNPKNNHAENLYWGTPKDNAQDSVRHRQNANVRKSHCPRGHLHAPFNCTSSHAESGRRGCLACHRARSYLKRHPESRGEIDKIADDYYRKLVEQNEGKRNAA